MKLSVGVLFASSSCLSMANAFFVIRVTSPHQAKTRSRAERQFLLRSTPPEASTKVDDYDVTCYIVNEEEIITDGEDPHVVCTAEPEEYAWYNGIDPKMMVKTDDAMEGAKECKEGESYNGKPEWECD